MAALILLQMTHLQYQGPQLAEVVELGVEVVILVLKFMILMELQAYYPTVLDT